MVMTTQGAVVESSFKIGPERINDNCYDGNYKNQFQYLLCPLINKTSLPVLFFLCCLSILPRISMDYSSHTGLYQISIFCQTSVLYFLAKSAIL